MSRSYHENLLHIWVNSNEFQSTVFMNFNGICLVWVELILNVHILIISKLQQFLYFQNFAFVSFLFKMDFKKLRLFPAHLLVYFKEYSINTTNVKVLRRNSRRWADCRFLSELEFLKTKTKCIFERRLYHWRNQCLMRIELTLHIEHYGSVAIVINLNIVNRFLLVIKATYFCRGIFKYALA